VQNWTALQFPFLWDGCHDSVTQKALNTVGVQGVSSIDPCGWVFVCIYACLCMRVFVSWYMYSGMLCVVVCVLMCVYLCICVCVFVSVYMLVCIWGSTLGYVVYSVFVHSTILCACVCIVCMFVYSVTVCVQCESVCVSLCVFGHVWILCECMCESRIPAGRPEHYLRAWS
jgi:hypothetical protein